MKNQIKVIYLIGGIGNVLFQINFGYYLQKLGFTVYYDITLLKPNSISKILKWSDHGTLDLMKKIGLDSNIQLVTSSKINLSFLYLSKFLKKRFFNYRYMGISTDKKDIEDIKYFLGYFHTNIEISNKLIDELQELIQKYLKNNSELTNQLKIVKHSRILHYRGGDYLKDDFRSISDSFYSYIFKKNIPDYIITNDIQNAVNHLNQFSKQEIKVINTNNALEDFILMVYANQLIISNSTFSWWASEIGYSNKIIQPDPLFNHVEWNVETNKNRLKYSIRSSSET